MAKTTKEILETLLKNKVANSNNDNEFKYIPQDEFSHKHSLVTNQESRNVNNFDDFLSKELAISYISSDDMLQLNAAHIRNVQMPLLQMKKTAQDPVLQKILENLFNFFHIPFMAELKMTRSKEGFERKLQANAMVQDQKKSSGFKFPKLNQQQDNSGNEVKLYE